MLMWSESPGRTPSPTGLLQSLVQTRLSSPAQTMAYKDYQLLHVKPHVTWLSQSSFHGPSPEP